MKEKKDEDVDKAKERDCFFIYKNWLMSMRYISREIIGSIMMCILNYTEKGILPKEEDPLIMAMFCQFKVNYDKDSEKYNEICRRNAENGRKGGNTKASKATSTSQPQQQTRSERPYEARERIVKESVDQRREEFLNEVMTTDNTRIYGQDVLMEFYNHWISLDTSCGLMEFEKERYSSNHGGFDVARRLQRWRSKGGKQQVESAGFIKPDIKPEI